MSVARELASLLGEGVVIAGEQNAAAPYLHDETETRAIAGHTDAVVLARTADEVAAVMAWCYQHDVPLIPRGGGTGFAGGAVPTGGGVLLSLERLVGGLKIEPEHWRAWAPAGTVTAELRRRVRTQGLYFAPDPGAAESSLIGGNIATNAGGPHTFKYGVTGSWVTGLELVLAPGEVVSIGGVARKDVGGYDLRSLLVGSEGTLGVITGAWLKLIPAPEAALPVVGLYADLDAGQNAILAALASGVVPAALEFLDAGSLRASLPALARAVDGFAADAVDRTEFMVIAEADGSPAEAGAGQAAIAEMLAEGAISVRTPTDSREIAALWRWRGAVSGAVTAQRGGKVSEDIVVPVERIADTVRKTIELGDQYELPACGWGHAGDGNIHATFMVDRTDTSGLARAELASHELFEYAATLGGAVSGEHGLGLVKNGALELQWPPRALDLHEQVKRLFDPKNLLNPGKKLAR